MSRRDFDSQYARDLDREPTYGQRPRIPLRATGTVRAMFESEEPTETDMMPFADEEATGVVVFATPTEISDRIEERRAIRAAEDAGLVTT